MYTITGGGILSRTNINQINSNFGELSGGGAAGGVDVYVNSQAGNNSNSGLTKGSPKATIAGLASVLEPGIRVGVQGVLFEEYSSPNVANVSLIGLGNQPLQGTTSGAPNGGGATWLSPSGGTGILLKLNGQGWTVQNIYFNNSAAQPCVQIMTSGSGDPPVDPDGAHAQILGCIFTGADCGIQASGGTNWVTIAGNSFTDFSGSGDCAIEQVTGAGVGTLLGWKLIGNNFFNNANHVILPLSTGLVTDNIFKVVGRSVTTTVALKLDGGVGSNTVYNNAFCRPVNTSPNATLYVGGTNDTWLQNFGTDANFFGVPDNS